MAAVPCVVIALGRTVAHTQASPSAVAHQPLKTRRDKAFASWCQPWSKPFRLRRRFSDLRDARQKRVLNARPGLTEISISPKQRYAGSCNLPNLDPRRRNFEQFYLPRSRQRDRPAPNDG